MELKQDFILSTDNPNMVSGVKRRRLFGPEDDRKLKALVTEHDFEGWKQIAKKMESFNARQCRDRWHNYLSPSVSFKPWTIEEDQIIVQKINEFGTRWSSIASFLPDPRFDAVAVAQQVNKQRKVLGIDKKMFDIHLNGEPIKIKEPPVTLEKEFIENFFEKISDAPSSSNQ